MKLGINTVVFGGEDLRTALGQIKLAGYDGAELSALQGQGAFGDPLGEHLHLDRWEQEVDEFRKLAGEFDLPMTAMEVGPLDEERVERGFLAAKALGIPIVNIGPSGKSDTHGDLEECIDRMARLVEKGEKAGVTLCVKAHAGASIHDTPTTLAAMGKIDSPYFGIDMDPSHIHRAGETPKDALKQVLSRVRHVHIRDCAGPGPDPGAPEMQTCGRGSIDLLGYCKVLVDGGYDGPVNVEIIGASRYGLSHCASIAAENRGYLAACLMLSKGRSA